MRHPVIQEDLDHILAQTNGLWDELRGKRVFITGGTGFFGVWLLESFVHANDVLGLGASALVLTRDPLAFARKCPHLAEHPAIDFLQGDVRNFDYPDGQFTHIIHAATEANVALNAGFPLTMLDTIVEGTRRVLDFALLCGAKKFLLTSSGAVYGKLPSEMSCVSEDYRGAPDPLDPRSAYGEGKRTAELLCSVYAKEHELEAKIARCFAFVGPHLPLDGAFAIGNFISNTLHSEPICIAGDGTPYRSYLYASDLAVWLWTILFKGQSGRAYNVGSDESISIAELASVVAEACGSRSEIHIAGKPMPGKPSERYVPCVDRAMSELGLRPTVSLKDAVRRTAAWNSKTANSILAGR